MNIFFLIQSFLGIAQNGNPSMRGVNKPIIKSSIYKAWPTPINPLICNNGAYVSYIIKNIPIGSSSLVLSSFDRKWQIQISEVESAAFTNDSRYAVFKKKDSLFLVELGMGIKLKFGDVGTFDVIEKHKRNYVVFYVGNNLVLCNLENGKVRSFKSVRDYVTCNGKGLILMVDDHTFNGQRAQKLISFDFNRENIDSIWSGSNYFGALYVDSKGSSVAFLISDTLHGANELSCVYKKITNGSYQSILERKNIGLADNLRIRTLNGFSQDGLKLYFKIEKTSNDSISQMIESNVRIWSSFDKKLKSLQSARSSDNSSIISYSLKERKVNYLIQEGDFTIGRTNNDMFLVRHADPGADRSEDSWNADARSVNYLVSADNERRIPIDKSGVYTYFSPEGKYVVYTVGVNLFCYEIATGIYRNLTEAIKTNWLQYYDEDLGASTRGIAGWIKGDEAILLYDRYDIWLIDPLQKRSALNLTNEYGRKHNIIFSLEMNISYHNPKSVPKEGKLILNAVNVITKENGFFQMDLKKRSDPSRLCFGSYFFNMPNNPYVYTTGIAPLKARDCGNYIVGRMSATESYNFFVTNDFKTFTPLSNTHPESSFNWYTTELISWKSKDNRTLQGVLYKPENFDPSKKYPIIFNFYEKRSFNLNVCLTPNYSESNINIPTYVSAGYLVFTPDIDFALGCPMQGAYYSVVSAAEYLSKFTYIDSLKMGIQGYSFGGTETNYLITRTNIFSAACSGGGLSDLVSAYGTLHRNGGAHTHFEPGGQYRIGGNLWDSTKSYITNSPIFYADFVSTPFLMAHGTNDQASPFTQAVEFFTALRRLGKKVWLLEYTDEGHAFHGQTIIDFDRRMRQFFDHFLLGEPAPKWLREGRWAGRDNENGRFEYSEGNH